MALTRKEKLALLAAISFMHNYGENFVPLIENGESSENKKAWKEVRIIYRNLHKRINKTLDKPDSG